MDQMSFLSDASGVSGPVGPILGTNDADGTTDPDSLLTFDDNGVDVRGASVAHLVGSLLVPHHMPIR